MEPGPLGAKKDVQPTGPHQPGQLGDFLLLHLLHLQNGNNSYLGRVFVGLSNVFNYCDHQVSALKNFG